LGGALLFSGRPDSTWKVPSELAEKLLAIWNELKPEDVKPPHAPPLGYRGAFLRDAGGHEWLAYCGVVTFRSAGRMESRRDPDKRFERTLLDSAPEGSLPES
jgi:hypothetical protein